MHLMTLRYSWVWDFSPFPNKPRLWHTTFSYQYPDGYTALFNKIGQAIKSVRV